MMQTLTTSIPTIADNDLVARVLADLSDEQRVALTAAERDLRAAVQHRQDIEDRNRTVQERITRLTAALTTPDGDQAALRAERTDLQHDVAFAADDRQAAVERQVKAEITFIGLALTAISSRNRAADIAAVDQQLGNVFGALRTMVWSEGVDRCYGHMRAIVDLYERRAGLPSAGDDESAISVLTSYVRDMVRPLGIGFRLRTDHRTGESSIPWGTVVATAQRSIPELVQAEMERTA